MNVSHYVEVEISDSGYYKYTVMIQKVGVAAWWLSGLLMWLQSMCYGMD